MYIRQLSPKCPAFPRFSWFSSVESHNDCYAAHGPQSQDGSEQKHLSLHRPSLADNTGSVNMRTRGFVLYNYQPMSSCGLDLSGSFSKLSILQDTRIYPRTRRKGWACHFRLDLSFRRNNRGLQITRFADMLAE